MPSPARLFLLWHWLTTSPINEGVSDGNICLMEWWISHVGVEISPIASHHARVEAGGSIKTPVPCAPSQVYLIWSLFPSLLVWPWATFLRNPPGTDHSVAGNKHGLAKRLGDWLRKCSEEMNRISRCLKIKIKTEVQQEAMVWIWWTQEVVGIISLHEAHIPFLFYFVLS